MQRRRLCFDVGGRLQPPVDGRRLDSSETDDRLYDRRARTEDGDRRVDEDQDDDDDDGCIEEETGQEGAGLQLADCGSSEGQTKTENNKGKEVDYGEKDWVQSDEEAAESEQIVWYLLCIDL